MNFATKYPLTRSVTALVSRAEHLAGRLDHEEIRSEHLFAELLRDSECQATKALVSLGLSPRRCLSGLEIVLQPKAFTPPNLLWSAEAGRVFLFARKEADRRPPDKNGEPNMIGSRELLIGFIRCGDGVAYGMINEHGIYLDVLRKKFGFPQDVWRRLPPVYVSTTPA